MTILKRSVAILRASNKRLTCYLNSSFLMLVLVLVGLIGCKKPENRKCYKSEGEREEKVIYVISFDSLLVGPKLKVHLIQGTENKVVIRAGKNMMNFILADESKSGWLRLSNTNNCSFLRKMNTQIEVDVFFTNLSFLDFQGSEMLTSGKLNIDSLIVRSRVGNGTLNLDVASHFLDVAANAGASNYFITGTVDNAYLGIGSNCYFDASTLVVSNFLECVTSSQGDAIVNVSGCNLNAILTTRGNIFYKGVPLNITKDERGEGRLIQY